MKKTIVVGLIILLAGLCLSFARAQNNAPAPSNQNQVASAAQTKITLDQILSIFKWLKEKIQIITTTGATNQAKLHLNLAKNRLDEYQTLKNQGKEEQAQNALNDYTNQLNKAVQKINAVKQQKSLEESAPELLPIIQKHLQSLNALYPNIPQPVKEKITNSIQLNQQLMGILKTNPSAKTNIKLSPRDSVKDFFNKLFKKLWPIVQ